MCFRVSKTKDHYQQFDSWRHSYFLLPLFFDLLASSFFIALLGHNHFIFYVTFSNDLGMLPSIWVSWALYAFWLSHDFFLFSYWNFLLPPSVGCDPSQDLFHERKIIQAQKGIARDILISERERNNKDGLSSFQAQVVKINKLWPHPIWSFGICKDAFHESWARSSLHTIIHTFKNTWFKSHRVRMFIHFFFLLLFLII